VGVDMGYSNEA